jgi:hypothetical protein
MKRDHGKNEYLQENCRRAEATPKIFVLAAFTTVRRKTA